MSDFKAVIFDMDGVLHDSESICDKTWEIAAKEYNLPDSSEIIAECRGCNKTDSIQIIKKHFGQDFPAKKFLERTSELFKEIEFTKGIDLMPYVKEALDYLKPKYRLALASSTRQESASRQLKGTGIYDYFETLTYGDMVEHSKPDPEIYLMACKSIGLKPEECVAIEDSPNGIRSAYAAGLSVIMVPDRIQPTAEIEKMCMKIIPSLGEIKNIL